MRGPLVLTFVTGSAIHQVYATGLYCCESGDQSNRQAIEVLKKKVGSDSWNVRKLKEDGAHYVVYTTTPEGNSDRLVFIL